MLLFLLRHAHAESNAESDAARPLSTRGIQQAETVRRFCSAHHIAPDIVLSSPLLRARQTAAIATGSEPVIEQWLASGMTPEAAVSGLGAYSKLRSVMIVGHQPDFGELAAWLLGLKSAAGIHLGKASLTALEAPVLKRGTVTIEFSLPVDFM